MDDELNAIKNRLEIYYQHEREILKFYNLVNHKVYDIDVDTSIENIYNLLHNLK